MTERIYTAEQLSELPAQGVEALMRALSQVDGVRKVEVLAG